MNEKFPILERKVQEFKQEPVMQLFQDGGSVQCDPAVSDAGEVAFPRPRVAMTTGARYHLHQLGRPARARWVCACHQALGA